ncbi:MAG: hypothetical protein K0R38_6263 [Polyangiaceae bacterium]|jgi:uncharacterized membrane protein YfcA|nr:hypothetical protein [Polyangiaceae bacterium]
MDLLSTSVLAGTALAVLIGVSLGLLGGGGSILTVPILVYVVGLATHEAIALSLLIVGTTSVAALVPHARAGRVRWRTGALFGATSMASAFVAGKLAHWIPGTVLLLFFGAMMFATAVAMMRGKPPGTCDDGALPAEGKLSELPLAKILAEGLSVGAVTGLVGAGGGFLVVPALMLFARLPMRSAVGTSLLVIAMKSFAAFGGYASATHVDWGFAAMATTAAVAGSFVGSGLAGRVPEALLRRGFAWFVVVMAVFILSQEVPRALGYRVQLGSAWPLVLGVSAVPLALAILDLARRARRAALPAPKLGKSVAH